MGDPRNELFDTFAPERERARNRELLDELVLVCMHRGCENMRKVCQVGPARS